MTISFLVSLFKDLPEINTDCITVPGTTNIKRFDENMGALRVKISKDEENEIRHLITNTEVKGTRYPEALSKSLFVDTVPLKA